LRDLVQNVTSGSTNPPDENHSDAVDNEIVSRARNEWIATTSGIFGTQIAMELYVCECSYGGCRATIGLTRDEYEAVRQDGMLFAIAVNHEDPETDRVVAEHARYAVVEKWLGDARRIANDTNPRRAPLTSWGGAGHG
jgi:hypothetical protein